MEVRRTPAATHKLASVTVIAPLAMRADALATALIVMDPVDGYEFTKREGSYLISNHSEATTLLTCTCSFDRGIQCQQVGLLCNAAYHVQHGTNSFTVFFNFLYRGSRSLDTYQDAA